MKAKTIIIIIVSIALLLAGYLYFKNDIMAISTKTIYKTDTLTVNRYIHDTQHDTIRTLIDRIIKVKAEPEIVYSQKVDTAFIIKTESMDLILNVKKETNGDLTIYAVNQNGKVLKEYIYHHVTGAFSATSQENNINVTYEKYSWNRININAEYYNSFTLKDRQLGIELFSGMTYMDKIPLNIGVELKEKQKPLWFAKLGYKF